VTLQDHVKEYVARGWRPVPLEPGVKFPRMEQWQQFDLAAELRNGKPLEDFFKPDSNVGLILGHGLVDVDLDCDQTVAAADLFLPEPAGVFGRASKPRSHRLFWIGPQDAPQRLAFADPAGGMLVELRSKNHQTMAPPSRHPSGETVEWDPAVAWRQNTTDFEALHRAVALLAVAALLARHWPAQGTRDETALAAAGTLLNCGLEPDDAKKVLEGVCRLVGTKKVKERAHDTVDATARKRDNGEAYAGGPRLAEHLGEHGKEAVKAIRKFLGVDADNEELLEAMNATHFVVEVGSDVCVGDERPDGVKIWPTHAFFKLYARKVQDGKHAKTLGSWWFDQERRRQYGELVFAPPPHETPRRAFNIWKGFASEPDPAASWALLEDHMRTIWCGGDEKLFAYLLDWFAMMAQKPGVPPEVALVLRGGRGAGKSLPLREIGDRWLGQHFIHISDANHLTGHFNAILSGKVFVFADEAFWAGDRSGERALKRLITEPTITIERKGIDPVKERNCVHLAIVGNDEWIAPFGMRERRFFVLDVKDSRQKDHAYFDALVRHFDEGAAAGFLAFCLARDLSHSNLRNVPATKAARDQQDFSLGDVEQWWLGKLTDGRILARHGGWRETATPCHELFDDYIKIAGLAGATRRSTELHVRRKLTSFLPPPRPAQTEPWPVRVRRRVAGGPAAGTYFYEFPGLAECRASWDRLTGMARDWPAVDDAGDEGEGAF
jgi:hypothetical protein